MSVLEDLSKYSEENPSHKSVKDSLLAKYDIPIQHFEFSYVETCSNGRELEKILHVLRSGEEGYYPDLIKATEERLRAIKPKSKFLREVSKVLTTRDLGQEESQEISEDLNNWVNKIKRNDKELESRKTKSLHHSSEIRRTKTDCKDDDTKSNKLKEKRISSTDYKAWDQYDPDTEILKMDLEEEKEIKKATTTQKSKPKKSVSFNKFGTEAECIFMSDREREKGNEFFKNGEYEEALQCYITSITIKPTVHNLNNRAATFLKLKKYNEALEDCEKVLGIDKNNVKANLRKGDALEKLEKYEEALEVAEFIINIDPNNDGAQNLAERVRKHCLSQVKNTTRIKIEEIE